LGDLLLSTPLFHWTKKTYPNQKLGLICRKGLGQPLLELGLIDFYWEIEKGNQKTYQNVIQELKKFEINQLISPHTSLRTALMVAQIKAHHKISFKKIWNFIFFQNRVSFEKQWPESIRLLKLIENRNPELQQNFNNLRPSEEYILKNETHDLLPAPSWADPGFCIDQNRVESKKQQYQINEKYRFNNAVALFPGSVWATKMWKKEKFIELGQSLHAKGFQVVIMGGPEEKTLGEEVARQIPGALQLCGKTNVLESLLLLTNVKLVIGNDSSSSHMAALMNRPVVSFFGPTVLHFGYRPWTGKVKVFEVNSLNCRPCGSHGPKVCPLGHHKCMQDLNITLQDLQPFLN